MIISDQQFRHATQGSVEVTLVGGPEDIHGKLWLPEELGNAEKIRIRYLAGYEHYEQTCQSAATGGADRVLTWTMRTKIAE